MIWHGSGLRAARGAAEACAIADIVVMSEPGAEHGLGQAVDRARAVLGHAAPEASGLRHRGCLVFDFTLLQDSGALALTVTDGALEITPARARQGDRLWTR